MKNKTKILILMILLISSLIIISLSSVSSVDAADGKNEVNNKVNVQKTVNKNVVKNAAKVTTITKSKANKIIKSKKPSSKSGTSTHIEAYDYKNKKMQWFKVKNSATISQYPAGLRKVTTNHKSKIKYALVTKTKTKTSYNKKTGVTTTTKYKILNNIKRSKYKLVRVNTTTSKQSTKKLANKYLEATTNAEVKNSMIVALAKKITKGVKSNDYYTKAAKIYKWVQEYIDYDLDANTSAVDILSKKGSNGHYKAYCVGFSNVMAALCRSVGVPVEYHAILFFEEEYYPFQGHEGHVYSKVYVKGQWLFADAATVGFIAPLNYKGYLQTMPTQTGGSYYTYTNNWNYWYFICNHNLNNHNDPTIIKEAQGVPVLEYFQLPYSSITSASTAYNILSGYASSNGYYIYKTDYITGSSDYITPEKFLPFWAFHVFDSSKNFVGYMVLSQAGILYPIWTWLPYETPGTNIGEIEYY